jgi:hypothetical protein
MAKTLLGKFRKAWTGDGRTDSIVKGKKLKSRKKKRNRK